MRGLQQVFAWTIPLACAVVAYRLHGSGEERFSTFFVVIVLYHRRMLSGVLDATPHCINQVVDGVYTGVVDDPSVENEDIIRIAWWHIRAEPRDSKSPGKI